MGDLARHFVLDMESSDLLVFRHSRAGGNPF